MIVDAKKSELYTQYQTYPCPTPKPSTGKTDCLPLTKTDIHARNPRRIFKPETGYSLNTLTISEEI